MELGDFWERQAEDWVRWAREPDHDSYWLFHRDRFLDLLPPPGRLTVDVGCGEGRLSRHLQELGHTVVAVDRSPTMIRHARDADPGLDVREADAAALPLQDGAADLVVSFMSLMNTDDTGRSRTTSGPWRGRLSWSSGRARSPIPRTMKGRLVGGGSRSSCTSGPLTRA